MKLVGGYASIKGVGEEKQAATFSYINGSDRNRWRRRVPLYGKVRYESVYPGVDLVYYGSERELEYDFLVSPGADPRRIALKFEGAAQVRVTPKRDLEIGLPSGGAIRHRKPVLYQEIDGARKSVKGSYAVREDGTVGFEVGTYDSSKPLVIDPVLLYSNVWGINQSDEPEAIAQDPQGNLYVAAYGPYGIGKSDLLLLKLNPQGDRLLNGLVLGGAEDERTPSMAVDSKENVYLYFRSESHDVEITPNEDEGFPLTDNGYIPKDDLYADAVLCKLDPAMEALLYSTRFKSYGDGALTMDANDNVYLTGRSDSYDLGTPGSYQPVRGCRGPQPFVAKFDMTRSGAESLVYATFLGGEVCGEGSDIAVDSMGSASVTGNVEGQMLVTPNAPQRSYGGGKDAFVAKVSPDGSRMLLATHLGGESTEEGRAIAVDANRNLYVTGEAYDTFPTTPGAYQSDYSGNANVSSQAFVIKINEDGSVAYSTYLGGVDTDYGTDIATDSQGNAYVAGYTESKNFPMKDPVQKELAGGMDAFVTVLNPSGTAIVSSTYLGGSGFDFVEAMVLDEARKTVHILGGTDSKSFPTVNPLSIESLPAKASDRGDYIIDLFLAKIDLAGGADPDPELKPGDLNNDGKINITDATLTLQAAVGARELTPQQMKAADRNGDGKVNIADATVVLRMAVGL